MKETPKALLDLCCARRKSSGYSEQTIERIRSNNSMYLKDMNIRRLTQINTKTVLTWGEKKLDTVSRSTLYTYYNSIRAFAKFLISQGYQLNIDLDQIRCKPHYKSRVWLRPNQIKQIIKHADPMSALLIRLMYTTGMRISEAVSIEEKDLLGDLTLYVKSKGGNMRPVFVTKEIYLELEEQSLKNGGPCFIYVDGEKMTRRKAYYLIKKAMISAGYPKAYPHALRHSFATELLRKGVSLSHTQRLMGHSSVAITQIYEHLVTDDIQKAHSKLTKL